MQPASDDGKKTEELKKKLINIEKDHKTPNASYNDLAKKMENKFESFEIKLSY